MNIELDQYFHQSLPRHALINERLSPLLTTIRKQNINSIHQLRKLDTDANPEVHSLPDPQDKGKTVFFWKPRGTLEEYLPEKSPKTARARFYSFQEARPKRSFKAVPSFHQNMQQRTILVGASSKVKRHLIDYIDFRQIQRAMHQNSIKLNKYQHFCRTIQEKRASHSLKAKLSSKTTKMTMNEFKETEGEIQSDEQYQGEELGFRITQRKRFWRPSAEGKKKTSFGHECLTVRGLLNTLG